MSGETYLPSFVPTEFRQTWRISSDTRWSLATSIVEDKNMNIHSQISNHMLVVEDL